MTGKKYLSVDEALNNYKKDNKNIDDLVQAAIDMSAKAESLVLKHKPMFNDTYNKIDKDLSQHFQNKSLDGIDPEKEIGELGNKIQDILVKHFTSELESTEEGKKELDALKNLGLNEKDYKNALLKTISSKHLNEKGEPMFDYVDLLNKKDTKIKDIYATIDGSMRAQTYATYLNAHEITHLSSGVAKHVPLYAARNLIKKYANHAGHGIHKNIMHLTNPADLILQTAVKLKQGTFKDKAEAEKHGIDLNAYKKNVKEALTKYDQNKAA